MKNIFCLSALLIILGFTSIICGEYVYPSGGEEFNGGDIISVQWNTNEMPYPVQIDLWNLNTLSYTTLATNHIDSTYSFTINNVNELTTLRIRVSSLSDSTRVQYSGTYFDVMPAPVLKSATSEAVTDNHFNIFPNPTNGIVNLPIDNIVKIDVYSIDGVLVNSIESVSSQIDLSNLPSGSYNLMIYKDDNSVVNTSLIKL